MDIAQKPFAPDLATEISRIKWYHSIDLGQGIITPGVGDTAARLPQYHLPADLSGQSVLDIGAWDGFFSFEAERRGASRVLATDWFCWCGEGWGSQAGFNLVRKALNSQVEDQAIDVMDISPETVGEFDVVLFLGVLYHLRDPLGALERVASVTRGRLILETHVDLCHLKQPALAFYQDRELCNDPTNWFGPNPPAVEAMLRSVGFARVEMVSLWPSSGALDRLKRSVRQLLRVGRRSENHSMQSTRAVFHAYKS
jgi:tRNA (mo5U34)-methyltransferase